jgi:hypothetical protein
VIVPHPRKDIPVAARDWPGEFPKPRMIDDAIGS